MLISITYVLFFVLNLFTLPIWREKEKKFLVGEKDIGQATNPMLLTRDPVRRGLIKKKTNHFTLNKIDKEHC